MSPVFEFQKYSFPSYLDNNVLEREKKNFQTSDYLLTTADVLTTRFEYSLARKYIAQTLIIAFVIFSNKFVFGMFNYI